MRYSGMPQSYEAVLADMVAAARSAGALTLTYFQRFRELEIGIKGPADFVSEADKESELLIRRDLCARYPEWSFVGEEFPPVKGVDSEYCWLVDPIDGTTNFINGFPAFAASIGVLYRGQPIAGALWCASTHALRAGVYHAYRGGLLHFDNEPLNPAQNPAIMRRLAGEPNLAHDKVHPFEVRKTGSAAIECAFVAAGLLRVARFERPNVWDIAGGVALVHAAGGGVVTLGRKGWEPFKVFSASGEDPDKQDIRNWHQPIILGERESVALVQAMHTSVG
jgi:myo-inositol-1(or 4)-monophosphatase